MNLNSILAAIAGLAIATALWKLKAASDGVVATPVTIGTTPAIVYRPAAGGLHPVVVIAHGFAGSQVLMRSFALTFARNGYTAVTFDFPGHGRNPAPLSGSITDASGATRVLVAEMRQVADFSRGLGDGRLAVLGHSMASDIVVRYAQQTPDVRATIAVSMYSPVVTATSPANLLIIVGDWESMLKREALRVVGLSSAPAAPRAGVTYGDPALGDARRAAFSAHVEHASVLFSEGSMRESLDWLDRAFGTQRTQPPVLDARGPWILLLVGGVVLLARPLATLLPRVAYPPLGAGRPWRRLWVPLLVPAIATPLLLRVLPTHFLPVLVADYLAVHFAMYGLITLACLAYTRPAARISPRPTQRLALAGATVAVTAFGFVALFWPIDTLVTSFLPGAQRIPLLLALLAGTLAFFLSDEWLTRGVGAARGAYAASKLLFLISLGLAVALDLKRLFFLIIIVPIILIFFLIYGLFSGWVYRRTGNPLVAGIANALACAWAIAATFPLLSG
jgi:alpha-beta hydrolase superfamily lysophospholipase